MKFTIELLFGMILATGAAGYGRTADHPSSSTVRPGVKALIDSTVVATYNYDFTRALRFADTMIASYPDGPEGYIYKCGIYSKMLVEECFASPDSVWRLYKQLADSACALSEREVSEDPKSVEALFHYASALVYRSRYEAASKDWFGLMSDGVKSKKMLEKALELNPEFYDAYSGIGAFDYYAAHLPWYLKPVALVLGINGDESEGIADLKMAAKSGNYSRTEAASFLAEIVYTDKGSYEEIARIALQLHDRYPGNLDFVKTLCFAYLKLHDYRKVIEYSNEALARISAKDSFRCLSFAYIRFYRGESFAAMRTHYDLAITDYSNAIQLGEPSVLVSEAYYGRGFVYEQLGRKKKAISDFETAIRLNGDDRTCSQARAALDSLKNR